MSAARTLTLKHPIKVETAEGVLTETITTLTFNRVKGKKMFAVLDANKGEGSRIRGLIAVSADVPPSVVDLMDAEDVAAAGEIVGDFFGASLSTLTR